MALPPPPIAPIGPLNPIDAVITGINTNTYLIGMSMIIMNLGGRHLAPSLTAEQDKFFQNQWVRRGMLFVVIFVATRNIFTAFWLSIGLIIIIGYLLNEHSSLYLFGEEQDIYKRLHDKVNRTKETTETEEKKMSLEQQLTSWYKENMRALRSVVS